MSRNELLEKILAARFDYDYAPRETKSHFQKILFVLLDQAATHHDSSRHEIMHALHDRYIEYKRDRRKQDRVSISQRLR